MEWIVKSGYDSTIKTSPTKAVTAMTTTNTNTATGKGQPIWIAVNSSEVNVKSPGMEF